MLRAEVYENWSPKIGMFNLEGVKFIRLTRERRAEAEAESGSGQPQVTEAEEIELESGAAEQNKVGLAMLICVMRILASYAQTTDMEV
jgi:hypothetical protein